jgi:hypothetical protein
VFILLLVSAPLYGANIQGLWSGSFQVADVTGGVEIRLTDADSQWRAEVQLQPNARLSGFPINNLKVRGRSVSWETRIIDGRQLWFRGWVEGGRLHGSVELLDGSPAVRGNWSAVRLTESAHTGTLPVPGGRYATGRMSFDWIDPDRTVMEAPLQKLKRELLVYVWYPSDNPRECSPAPYLPDVALMPMPVWPQAVLTIPGVNTHSCLGAPLSKREKQYPVLIFSPGDEVKTLGYSALQEDLASHGYVVIAIEHPYNAPIVVFPDGRIIRPLPPPTPLPAVSGEEERKRQYAQTLADLDYWAHDIAFVASQVQKLDSDLTWPFHGRLDTARIGAFGHSRGGLAVFRACQIDPTIRACVNIDGKYRVRPYPMSSPSEAPKQPFMWMRTPQEVFTDQELAQRGHSRDQFQSEVEIGKSILRAVAGGSWDAKIVQVGLDHDDFTDFRVLESGLSPETVATRKRTLEITNACLLAFFDITLRGKRKELTSRSLMRRFPEVDLSQYGHIASE